MLRINSSISSGRMGIPAIEPMARVNPRNSARNFRLMDNGSSRVSRCYADLLQAFGHTGWLCETRRVTARGTHVQFLTQCIQRELCGWRSSGGELGNAGKRLHRAAFGIAVQRHRNKSDREKEERNEKNGKYATHREQPREQHERQTERRQRSARREHSLKLAAKMIQQSREVIAQLPILQLRVRPSQSSLPRRPIRRQTC